MRRSRSTLPHFRLTALVVTALLAFAAVPAVAAAADRYVATTGDDASNDCLTEATPCRTIQHAVDVAVADDTIDVAAGTYTESVVAGKTLEFDGPSSCGCPDDVAEDPDRDDSDEARWNGDGSNPALEIDAENVTVVGFTFGPAAGPPAGEAIQVDSGADAAGIGYSIFENLERGIDLDGPAATFIQINLFQDSLEGVAGFSDDTTGVLFNYFSANTTAVSLDGSSNGTVSMNASDGDAVFVRSRQTDAMSFGSDTIGALGNEVTGVTDAGYVFAGDADVTMQFGSVTGPGDGVRIVPDGGGSLGEATFEYNDFHDLGGSAIDAADGSLSDPLGVHGNRFFATTGTAVVAAGDSEIDATNNWWGCNEGPGAPGCEGTGGDGTVLADPWTVMTLTADPTSIATGGNDSAITASFNTNSDGEEIVEQGVPDDVQVAFATTLGTVDPDTNCTCFGLSFTTLTSGAVPGIATVSATADSETVTADVTFTGAQARIAPAGGFDFGPVRLGGFSPLQKFTVKNVGNEDLVVSSVGIDSDQFDLAAGYDACANATLAPGAFCSVKIRFVPSGFPGPVTASFIVDSNAAGAPATAPLSGTAVPPGELTVKPTAFDFGTVPVGGMSGLQKFAVKNTGATSVTVGGVSLGGGDASEFAVSNDLCTGQTLAPGASCTVRGRFTPTTGGDKSATLEASSDDIATTATANLQGTASTTAALAIAPGSFSFGAVVIGTPSPNQKFTVKNTGGSPVHVDSVEPAGGDAAQFQRNGSTCVDVDLAPGASCAVKVRFRPTGTPGPRSTQVVVTSDVPGTTAADVSGDAVTG